MVQAIAVANHVKKVGATAVAHGSTGAGNDQVRFDMVFQGMLPGVEIITPIRDLRLSREEEIAFLKENGVDMNVAKAKYSINKGLWGTSVGGKETLTSKEYLPEDAWPTAVTETGTRELVLEFEKGELKGVDGRQFSNPVEAIQRLQSIASPMASAGISMSVTPLSASRAGLASRPRLRLSSSRRIICWRSIR
jgi:argininosuccinate synthase